MNDITVTLTNKRYAAIHPCSKHKVFLRGAHMSFTTWRTVIHYFYGEQLYDGELIYKVLLAATPDDARAIANDAPTEKRADWSAQKAADTIRTAIRSKVMQHPAVRSALLRTGDSAIALDLTNCGQWQHDPVFADGRLLSETLMGIRDELTKDGPFDELKDPLLPPWLKFPDVPPGSIGWRMGNGEGYLCEFNPWYRGLTVEGRRKYKEIYPPPKEWR
jgi:N-glycosidase YbiA